MTDVDEAMLTLRLGLKHRHVASTRLNQQSSRSHSIYTIKLVRLANVKNPVNAIVNRLVVISFVVSTANQMLHKFALYFKIKVGIIVLLQ